VHDCFVPSFFPGRRLRPCFNGVDAPASLRPLFCLSMPCRIIISIGADLLGAKVEKFSQKSQWERRSQKNSALKMKFSLPMFCLYGLYQCTKLHIFQTKSWKKFSEKGHSSFPICHPAGLRRHPSQHTLTPEEKGKVGAYDNLILYQEHALKKALILL